MKFVHNSKIFCIKNLKIETSNGNYIIKDNNKYIKN